MSWLHYDDGLTDVIASQMDLRKPNAEALNALAKQVSRGDGREVIADLATGVGKTYLAAALIDYLAQKGVRNILLVTPGSTILTKTVANFTPGSPKYVPGAEVRPLLVTADNFERGEVGEALHDPKRLKVFLFNVQQLISPGVKNSRRTRSENEHIGGALYEHLREADDLVVIADEHHVYREKAMRFNAAISDLGARAVVGLTATPDQADVEAGKVVYRYPLANAIADELVKIPVIVYRADGRKDLHTQLADACLLRAKKEPIWVAYANAAGVAPVYPVLFVVAQSIEDAKSVADELTSETMLPGDGQVLLITSESSDQALEALANVERPDSLVRAIVSVDKLKEGWDVKNIGVIVAYRALASKTLTEQVLGRGLRLPFGRRTSLPGIDQVDLVAHESYQQLLRDKNALLEQIMGSPAKPGTKDVVQKLDFTTLSGIGEPGSPEQGFAVTTGQTLDGVSAAELLLAQEFDAVIRQTENDLQAVAKPMPLNLFPPITFPSQEKVAEPVKFTLSKVDLLLVEQQGRLVAHDPDVKLVRRELNAIRGLDGSIIVVDRSGGDETATRHVVDAATVRGDLIAKVMDSGMVEPELVEMARAVEIVDAFLLGADVDEASEWEWSIDHAHRAADKLFALIASTRKGQQLVVNYRWTPSKVPAPRSLPQAPRAVWDEYRKGDWIGPWEHSIEKYARFDSQSAELSLARKIENWGPTVSYWQRLYVHDGAFIPWTGGRYFPDFLVVDKDKVHWVLEAKSDKAAVDSAEVTAKAEAAEAWVGRVNAIKHFGVWRYRIVTEAQIAAAADWESIVAGG